MAEYKTRIRQLSGKAVRVARTRRRKISRSASGITDEFQLDGNIPLIGNLGQNPLGIIIATLLFFVMIYWWGQPGLGSPFDGVSIVLGNGSPGLFTGLWTGFYNNFNWFGIISFGLFPVAMLYAMLLRNKGPEEEAEAEPVEE